MSTRNSDPPPSIQQVISPLLIPAYLFRFDWIVCCSRYGQFLTAAETADLLAPDISAYNQVESWLSAGVSAAGNVKKINTHMHSDASIGSFHRLLSGTELERQHLF